MQGGWYRISSEGGRLPLVGAMRGVASYENMLRGRLPSVSAVASLVDIHRVRFRLCR